jgi:hypothetical protein
MASEHFKDEICVWALAFTEMNPIVPSKIKRDLFRKIFVISVLPFPGGTACHAQKLQACCRDDFSYWMI